MATARPVGDQTGNTDLSCLGKTGLGKAGAGGGVWLKEVGGWVQPNMIVAVLLSKTNKARNLWSWVQVFSGLKYLYLYLYPQLNLWVYPYS